MKRFISVLAYILVIIGALNWGLWGFFQFDLVAWLFHGNTTMLSRVIYAVIGLAGIWSIGSIGCCCKAMCSKCCPGCGKCGDKCTCNKADINNKSGFVNKSDINKSGTCPNCGKNGSNCTCNKPGFNKSGSCSCCGGSNCNCNCTKGPK